jgi:hypothetical protein
VVSAVFCRLLHRRAAAQDDQISERNPLSTTL